MSGRYDDYLSTGPFAKATMGVDTFANNIYFTYLFDESVKKHQELEKEYLRACEENDEVAMTQMQYEIDFYNGIFNLTLTFNNFNELES